MSSDLGKGVAGAPERRALVLSGSIGHGHDSVARACALALEGDAYEVEVLDCLELLGRASARIGAGLFRRAFAVAPLYDAFHFSGLRGGGAIGEWIARDSTNRLYSPLGAALDRQRAGLAISVFPTGVGALARLRQARPELRAVALLTDATAHRVWVAEGIDRYLVCSEMAAGSVRQYLPGADIAVIPPPVQPEFFDAPSPDDARRQLDLPPFVRIVLLLAGAWASGPLAAVAAGLVEAGLETVVVAGHSKPALRALSSLERRRHEGGAGIRVIGFTGAMPALLAACDAVVSTPGQTCHEARVVGRPLVVIDSVPGHGRENLLHELARPGAIASRPQPGAVVAAVRAALAGAGGIAEPWPVKSPEEWAELLRAALGGLGGQLGEDSSAETSQVTPERSRAARSPSPLRKRTSSIWPLRSEP